MSNETTWTDEQLQSHIALWEKMQQNGEQLDLTIYNKVVMNPWEGSGYSVKFGGEHVALTFEQAFMVERWMQSQIAEKSKPDKIDTPLALLRECFEILEDIENDGWVVRGGKSATIPPLLARMRAFAAKEVENS